MGGVLPREGRGRPTEVTAPAGARSSGAGAEARALGRRDGQRDAEARAAALARVARDAASVRLDDVARDREAEAGPLALRREERVEHALPDLLGDAPSPVCDVDHHAHALRL